MGTCGVLGAFSLRLYKGDMLSPSLQVISLSYVIQCNGKHNVPSPILYLSNLSPIYLMMPLITLLNDTIDMVILNKHTNPDKQKPEMGSWNI